MEIGPGDRILTARSEYISNMLGLLQVSRRTGVRIEVVEDDEHGQLSVVDPERRLDSDVKLVAITHVPTGGGLVNPAAEVGALTKSAGLPFLLDACQSVGQLPVDVEEIGCNMLSATGRKFWRGPRGTGFLYVRRGLIKKLEPPFLDTHAANWTGPDEYVILPDARRFESWEGYVAGKIGLGVAVDYALSWGIEPIAERVQSLAESLRYRDLHGFRRGLRVGLSGIGLGLRQRYGDVGRRCSARPAPAWPDRAGKGLGALLQHRGRAGPDGGGAATPNPRELNSLQVRFSRRRGAARLHWRRMAGR